MNSQDTACTQEYCDIYLIPLAMAATINTIITHAVGLLSCCSYYEEVVLHFFDLCNRTCFIIKGCGI